MQDLALLAQGLGLVLAQVGALVRGQEAAFGHPDLVGLRVLQVFHESAGALAVLGDRHDRAAAQDRVAQLLAGVGREVEEVGVFGLAFGEEGGDEAGLAVHVALGGGAEHALGAVLEAHGGHGLGATVHVGVVAGEPAIGLDRFNHALVVELHLVAGPVVVDLRALGAQHHVFHPVGGGPAGRGVTAQADAPGLATVGGDLLGQVLQLLHGLGHLVALFLEVLRDVPDQALDVHVVEEAVELFLAGLVLVGAQVGPGAAGGVVGLDPVASLVAQRRQSTDGGHVGGQAGLREDGEVGRRAGLDVDHDLLLGALRARVLHRGAGGLLEVGDDLLEHAFFRTGPGAGDGDYLALQIGSLVVGGHGRATQGGQGQGGGAGDGACLEHLLLLLCRHRGPSATPWVGYPRGGVRQMRSPAASKRYRCSGW